MRMPSPAEATGLAHSARAPLVVLVGPTAVGKTALSLALAEAVGGEVVSADSRQVYRHMDIGTAKPLPADLRRVPHHLVDILDPDQTLGLAEYQAAALRAISGIVRRERVPLLVGGTGQYVMAVAEGWQIPRVPPDTTLRARLYDEASCLGVAALHARLAGLDPVAAAAIDPRNVRRVVRALEVCMTSGQRISEQRGKVPPPYRILLVGLALPRPDLYRRIDERVDRMMQDGLEQEVRGLVAAGYGFDLPSMSGVGYGQFAPYLSGEVTLAQVLQAVKHATRRFVRQQSTWFRADDSRIHWFPAAPDPLDAILTLVAGFLD